MLLFGFHQLLGDVMPDIKPSSGQLRLDPTVQNEADIADHAALRESGKGPHIGGFCADCGHMAVRHHGRSCHFPRVKYGYGEPCACEGMLWEGERYEMDCVAGPIRVFRLEVEQ